MGEGKFFGDMLNLYFGLVILYEISYSKLFFFEKGLCITIKEASVYFSITKIFFMMLMNRQVILV